MEAQLAVAADEEDGQQAEEHQGKFPAEDEANGDGPEEADRGGDQHGETREHEADIGHIAGESRAQLPRSVAGVVEEGDLRFARGTPLTSCRRMFLKAANRSFFVRDSLQRPRKCAWKSCQRKAPLTAMKFPAKTVTARARKAPHQRRTSPFMSSTDSLNTLKI